MIHKIITKSSKFVPILVRKVKNSNFNINQKILLLNSQMNLLIKTPLFYFSDKKDKGEKNKEKSKEQKPKENKSKVKQLVNKVELEKINIEEIENNDLIEQKILNEEDFDLDELDEELDDQKEWESYPKIKFEENEMKKLNLQDHQIKQMKILEEILNEKDMTIANKKYMNFVIEVAEEQLGIESHEYESKDYEKIIIDHAYEKQSGIIPKEEKEFLENEAKKLLQDYEIGAKDAEFLKERRLDPLTHSLFERFRDLKNPSDIINNLGTFTDYKNFEYVLERFDKLVQLARESKDHQNPAFIAQRSMNKVLKDSQKIIPKPRNIDRRQNALSKDYLKIQPRVNLDYSYNIEQNKEFYFKFKDIFEEDQKKLLAKMKLIKFIKSNPEKSGVKSRWLSNHFDVPLEKLPDYNVDITGFKPIQKKKSKRKYEKKMLTDISNYEAWRVFDRDSLFHDNESMHVHVELTPMNLINKFGPPSSPGFDESTGSYYFEDENLDVFYLTDHSQTVKTNGPNYEDEFYIEQEKCVQEKLRKKKWPTPQQFWESTEKRKFKLFYPNKSDMKRFKKWLRFQVNYFDSTKEKTILEIAEEKYGKLDDYSDYKKDRKTVLVNAIYNYEPSFFMDKDEKIIFKPEPFPIPKYIPIEEGEFFDYDEYMKIEASKTRDVNKIII